MVPTYHIVVPSGSQFHYSCTTQQLAEQLRYLSESWPATGVSFDDGHVSNYRYALPLLQRHRVRAIFFVVAGWIGRRAESMTWHQAREIADCGHEVQSHSLSHPMLTACTDAELVSELKISRQVIANNIGRAVDAISIPFGRCDQRVLRACAQAGYSRVYTSEIHYLPATADCPEIRGRFMVTRTTKLRDLQRMMTATDRDLFLVRAQHQCKLLARRAIGESAYHWLWGALRFRRAMHSGY